jgi:hypothetical protein
MILHLEQEVELIKSQLPQPTINEVVDFKSKLDELKSNPYVWKVIFPDFDERKSILQQINKLKKKLGYQSNYELIKYLVECEGNDLNAS